MRGLKRLLSPIIPSLAIVKVNWDNERDYIENYVPFFAHIIRNSPIDTVSAEYVQSTLTEEFGLVLPAGAVNTVLSRMVGQGFVTRNQGQYVRNSARLKESDLTKRRSDATRYYQSVVIQLRDSANSKYNLGWSEEDAASALDEYLENNHAMVLGAIYQGSEVFARSNHTEAEHFVVASFILDVLETDPTTVEYLTDVVKGAMLASALFLPNPGSVQGTFNNLTVYFDTRFILQLMGLDSVASSDSCKELLRLLMDQNAKLEVFSETVSEITGILEAAKFVVSDRRVGNATAWGASRVILDQQWTVSDIELEIERINTRLSGFGISTVNHPDYAKTTTLNEDALAGELKRRYSKDTSDSAITHDVACIAAIQHLRAGVTPRYVESATAIFVTTNHAMIEVARDHVAADSGGMVGLWIPPCISESALTTVAWLKSPEAAPDLPRRQLIADCYAALNPSDSMWADYLVEVDRLMERDDINEDAYVLLRYAPAARRALMDTTLGHVASLTRGDVSSILERVQQDIRQDESDRADAAEAALSKELANTKEAVSKAALLERGVEEGRRERSRKIRVIADRISSGLVGVGLAILAVLIFIGEGAAI